MMKKMCRFSCLLIPFLFVILLHPINMGHTKTRDKIILQKETKFHLAKIDELSKKSKSMNALFTDQRPENICEHAKHYKSLTDLLDNLEKNLNDWNDLVKQNINDKVYRAFVATIQIAMYTIYSRPDEYLGFLKIYNSDNKNNICREPPIKQDIPVWEDKKSEWAIKAESYLVRAKESIDKALELDPYYEDARILQAQLMVLQGNYKYAQTLFNKLASEGLFENRRSFFNSWKAYIFMKQGNKLGGEKNLKNAAAFSEPPENSSWASRYIRTLRSARTKWIVFEAREFEPPETRDLSELKKQSKQLMASIRYELIKPLRQIPKNFKGMKKQDFFKLSGLYINPQFDHSEENLLRFAVMIEILYEKGSELEKITKEWDELAEANEEVTYYYLMYKSACNLALAETAVFTKSLFDDKQLIKLLKKRLKEEDKEDIEYAAKWEEWHQIVDQLRNEIEMIYAEKSEFLPSRLLSFEFDAILANPDIALKKLEALTPVLQKFKKQKLLVFSGHGTDIQIYIDSWKTYLAYRKNDIELAKEYLLKAKEKRGFGDWKDNYTKMIGLKEFLADEN